MASIQIEQIEKSFGPTSVLKGVSLDIKDGEFISLVGPSGCGKSTLLRIIAGLEGQDAGNILIDGHAVNAVRAADRNLSMVFQSYALYPHLSVAENIGVPLKMGEMTRWQRMPLVGPFMPGSKAVSKRIGAAVEKAATTLQIQHLLGRKPGQLSGGQRQRVAVGRALVRDPAAFLLDEPLSNLDAKLRVHTRAEIAQLHRQLGATFIYVTHDQVEAMTMSDRIAVMMDGEILQVGTPAEVYDSPADIRVAEFMGLPKIAILPGNAGPNGEITLSGNATGMASSLVSTPLSVGIRPEHLQVTDSAHARVEGTVTHLENLGSEVYAHILLDKADAPIVVRAGREILHKLAVNQPVGLTFDPAHMHVFDHEGRRVVAPVTSMHAPADTRRAAND